MVDPVTTLNKEDVGRMIRAIRFLHDETGGFLDSWQGIPADSSQAARELIEFGERASMMEPYAQGHILIEGAADQMIAVTKTLSEPVQTIAPWTCVRAALESSALAAWLLDPGIDARSRLQRSYSLRYEGLTQQLKFARSAGVDPSDVAYIETRIDTIESRAISLGFSRIANKKGRREGIGQKMPSATEIIAQMLDEEAQYRLLSAVAHGHLWAIQQLSFCLVDGEVPRSLPKGDENIEVLHRLKKSLTAKGAILMCVLTAKNFAKPVWYKSQLFGWDLTRLSGIFETAFDHLCLKGPLRFWRIHD